VTALIESPPASTRADGVGVRSVFRAEWRKLTAQLSTRVLALVCLLGPIAYVVVLKTQSGVPTDALLGVWAHSSGFSVVFVLLVFAGSWGFPVLAGVAAGDSFASESRHGTWKTVLTRSCTRRELFVGKVLAVTALTEALVVLLAFSTVVSSVLIVGHQPAVGVSGNVMSASHALFAVLVSWLWEMVPVLAFTGLAVLFSVATASGIAGVLGPVLVGYSMQLLALVGGSKWAHFLLVGSAFDGWHTFASAHPYYRQLLVSAAVSIGWTVATLGAAWLILRRREFDSSGESRATDWPRLLRGVVVSIAALVLAAFACTWGPTGITEQRLENSIDRTFGNLTIYQQQLLGRAVPPHASLRSFTSCLRRGHASRGPGDDWACSLQIFAPNSAGSNITQFHVTYEVEVQSNGCYRAEGPPAFIGQRTLAVAGGREVVNPLFIMYGCFNTL
jgi:ABC-2 type transport system permease protein